MNWSLPLAGQSGPAGRRAAPLFSALTLVALVLPMNAGCSALPVMQSAPVQVAMLDGKARINEYSDVEKLRLSQIPRTPDFDLPTGVIPATHQIASVGPGAKTPSPPQPALSAVPLSDAPPKGVVPKTSVASQAITGPGQKSFTPADAESSVQLPMLRIDAPKPFAWATTGKTSGERSFQTMTIGDDGYRSLVIGSVAGNDPLALELVEQLARHLHAGKTILGGFNCTVLRTLNPDGEALRNVLNAKGQYINHGFPKDNNIAEGKQPVEVKFLLSQIDTLQPQRVIHIRTIEGNNGLIAANSSALAMARDSGGWLGFRVINLPGKAVSGSLERYLASSGRCDIVTFAIPATTKKTELWQSYGDALQNLLLSEDTATRELARQQTQQSSANSRDANDR